MDEKLVFILTDHDPTSPFINSQEVYIYNEATMEFEHHGRHTNGIEGQYKKTEIRLEENGGFHNLPNFNMLSVEDLADRIGMNVQMFTDTHLRDMEADLKIRNASNAAYKIITHKIDDAGITPSHQEEVIITFGSGQTMTDVEDRYTPQDAKKIQGFVQEALTTLDGYKISDKLTEFFSSEKLVGKTIEIAPETDSLQSKLDEVKSGFENFIIDSAQIQTDSIPLPQPQQQAQRGGRN